jgi:hypothetical protein
MDKSINGVLPALLIKQVAGGQRVVIATDKQFQFRSHHFSQFDGFIKPWLLFMLMLGLHDHKDFVKDSHDPACLRE